MNNTYTSLVNQTFHFPQEGFEVDDNGYLQFNGLDLKEIIEKHGTPLKLTYLPKVGMQIKKAKQMFANAFKIVKFGLRQAVDSRLFGFSFLVSN